MPDVNNSAFEFSIGIVAGTDVTFLQFGSGSNPGITIGGTPINWAGWTGDITIRSLINDSVFSTMSTTNGAMVYGSNGSITAKMSSNPLASNTSVIPSSHPCYWVMRNIDPSGNVNIWYKGTVVVG